VDPITQWDFYALCRALQKHRQANPRYKLDTNMQSIEQEIDNVNAMRVASMNGADSYVINDAAASFPQAPAPVGRLQQVAAAVKRVSAGADTLNEWEDSGEPPVAAGVSQHRASVCAICPQNEKGDLSRWFTLPLAAFIKRKIEWIHKLKLVTSYDDQLGVCGACLCPLKLKVHTPISFVLKHMSEDVKTALQPQNPRCWVLKESDAP
jgi:hypothetical protein